MRIVCNFRGLGMAALFALVSTVGCTVPPSGNGGDGNGNGSGDVCTNGFDNMDTNGICTNGVGNDDMGGDSSDGGDAGDGPFRLTLTLRGDGDTEGMTVYRVIDSVAYTRENAPYSNFNLSIGVSSSSDPDVREVMIQKGQTVTLIAVEARGVISALPLNDDANLTSPFNHEFSKFEGDVGSMPEEGVAVIEMNSDKDVTAVFKSMPTVSIVKSDEVKPQLSGGCYDLTIDAPERLGRPGDSDISGMTNDVCNARSGGQVKTGTMIALNAKDTNGCDVVSGDCSEMFDRWDGDTASCGSNRECTFEVMDDTNVEAIWRDES